MCATAPAMPMSAPDEHAVEVMVPMRDGTRLATDVYLPRGRGPHATLLARVPYDKGGDIALMPAVAGFMIDRGYAVVVQDVRGKARSEGSTAAFVHELDDGYDTLEWLSGQPWCRPGIGMLGDSYYGWTQWAAAASGHPELRAIAPRVTSTRIGRDWMYQGGAFSLAAMADWAALTWVDHRLYEYVPDWTVRPLSDLLPAWLGGLRSESLDQWSAWQADGEEWQRGAFVEVTAAKLRIPALHLGGWWDIFHRGQIADWAVASQGAHAPQRLIMDAADHQWEPWRAGGEALADSRGATRSFDAFLRRYLDPVASFMDRELRGKDTARSDPVVRFHIAGAGWRESSSWPPPGVEPLELWLDDGARAPLGPEGGALVRRPPAGDHTVRWTHDPADLVPTLDEDVWWPLLRLPDERDVQVRADVLTFTASPLEHHLDVAGPVCAILSAGAARFAFQVAAKLLDVSPDGTAWRVAEGVQTVPDVRHEPRLEVDLGHTAYRFAAGHRLRLAIAGSSFPRYAPVSGPGAHDKRDNELHLRTGARRGSRLCLFVLR